MVKKAILLAGGQGTRLRPFTYYTSKHLLPVFNQPMIFYPLTNLMLLGVEKVCIIINSYHRDQWLQLFNSLDLKLEITFVEQEKPEGIPQAITICESFINNDPFYLALGDNILLASGLLNRFVNLIEENLTDCVIIGYSVPNPSEFGVADFDKNGKLKKVVEKPLDYISDIAIVGLYKFDKKAVDFAKSIKKSARGEYEITDIINLYIAQGKCRLIKCDAGTDYWLDTGSVSAITSASIFIRELSLSGVKTVGDPLSLNKSN